MAYLPYSVSATFTAGSAVVTAAAAVFAANVVPGDWVRAPDERIYLIQSVDSNTQLTLTRAYVGSTTTALAEFAKHSPQWGSVADANARLARIETAVTTQTITSSSAVAIGMGDKTFLVESGLSVAPTARLRAVSRSNTANVMAGVVKSYAGNTLVLTVDFVSGSGSPSDWNITYTGEKGGTFSAPSTTVVNRLLKSADTTGASMVQTAALSEDWAGNVFANSFRAGGVYPMVSWTESDAAADNRAWDVVVDNGWMYFRAINDAYNASTNWISVGRSGHTVTAVSFGARVTAPAQIDITTPGTGVWDQSGFNLHTKADGASLGTATNKGWSWYARGNAYNLPAQQNMFGMAYWDGAAWGPGLSMLPNGNFGIGSTAPGYKLTVATDSAAKPGTNTWTISSDERLKTGIVDADLSRCWDIVSGIRLRRYTWRDDVYTDDQVPDRSKLGWIAQEVQPYFPMSVSAAPFRPDHDDTGELEIEDCLSLNADQIYASMYGALQLAMQKITALEAEVAALKQQN